MTLFYIKFIITNLLFSLIIGVFWLRFRGGGESGERPGPGELLLVSLGSGPAVTVLFLYLLMLLVPRQSITFYLGAVLGLYTLLAFWCRAGFKLLRRHLSTSVAAAKSRWQQARSSQKVIKTIYTLVIIAFLAVYWTGYTGTIQHNPLIGHDALVYGNLGKMYFHDRQITYSKVMLPASNGFIFQGTPKPAFSLLLTWELMVNHALLTQKEEREILQTIYFDTYYRGISGYYGLLILALGFMWLRRFNRYLPWVGLVVVAAGMNFFLMTVNPHLDSIRIYFLLLSWIWLGYALERKDMFSLISFAIFSGLACFYHVIGLVLVLINGAVYFLLMSGKWRQRLQHATLFLLVLLACGGIHYLLEAFVGSEWGITSYLSRFLFFWRN